MPRVQFVGQISLSYGNTLPELCSRLKNFGVGRLFVRTAHDQNKEVSYIVLTRSRPLITQTPPKVIVGRLEEITALTKKTSDTQSEFFGRVIQNGFIMNGGKEINIPSATNPDWRLILKEDEEYYLKNTTKQQETLDKDSEQINVNLLQKHIPDIIKFWARTNG